MVAFTGKTGPSATQAVAPKSAPSSLLDKAALPRWASASVMAATESEGTSFPERFARSWENVPLFAAPATTRGLAESGTVNAARDAGAPGPLGQRSFAGIPAYAGRSGVAARPFAAPIQAKLAVGRQDDPLEQEADRVADTVLRMSAPAAAGGATHQGLGSSPAVVSGRLQRQCADCEKDEDGDEKEEHVQRKAGPQGAGDTMQAPSIVGETLNSGQGRPLDAATRAYFEPRFGQDFSRVRVHTGERAGESARSVNALAYTVGPNIVFGAGRYAPAAPEGRRLLAHELTHVVQQSGSAAGPGALAVRRAPADVLRRKPDDSETRLLQAFDGSGVKLAYTAVAMLEIKGFASHPPDAVETSEALSTAVDGAYGKLRKIFLNKLHYATMPPGTIRLVVSSALDDATMANVRTMADTCNSTVVVYRAASPTSIVKETTVTPTAMAIAPPPAKTANAVAPASSPAAAQGQPSSAPSTAMLDGSSYARTTVASTGTTGGAMLLYELYGGNVLGGDTGLPQGTLVHLKSSLANGLAYEVIVVDGEYEGEQGVLSRSFIKAAPAPVAATPAEKPAVDPGGAAPQEAASAPAATTRIRAALALLQNVRTAVLADPKDTAKAIEILQRMTAFFNDIITDTKIHETFAGWVAFDQFTVNRRLLDAKGAPAALLDKVKDRAANEETFKTEIGYVVEARQYLEILAGDRPDRKVLASEQKVFEHETKKIAFEMLAAFENQLLQQRRKYQDAACISALVDALAKTTAKADYTESDRLNRSVAETNSKNRYQPAGIPGGRVSLERIAGEKKLAAQTETAKQIAAEGNAQVSTIAEQHPLVKLPDFPRESLARSDGAEAAKSVMDSYIDEHLGYVADTRSGLDDNIDVIYSENLDRLMKESYLRQGIVPGSLRDLAVENHKADREHADLVGSYIENTFLLIFTIATWGAGGLAVKAAQAAVAVKFAAEAVHNADEAAATFGTGLSSVPPDAAWVIIACMMAAVEVVGALSEILPAVRAYNQGKDAARFLAALKEQGASKEVIDALSKMTGPGMSLEREAIGRLYSKLGKDAEKLKRLLKFHTGLELERMAAPELEEAIGAASAAGEKSPTANGKLVGGAESPISGEQAPVAKPPATGEPPPAGDERLRVGIGIPEAEAEASAIAERPTLDGAHGIKVTPAGDCIRCSPICNRLRNIYASQLVRGSPLEAELAGIEMRASAAARAKNVAAANIAVDQAVALEHRLAAFEFDRLRIDFPKLTPEYGAAIRARGVDAATLENLLRAGTPKGMTIEDVVLIADTGGLLGVRNAGAVMALPSGTVSEALDAATAAEGLQHGIRPPKSVFRFPETTPRFKASTPEAAYAAAIADARVQSGLGAYEIPFRQETGPRVGEISGRMASDGSHGWRLDFDPKSDKAFHINWWRIDATGYHQGANLIDGATEELYDAMMKALAGGHR
jgi:uncharacterized protein DUF4157